MSSWKGVKVRHTDGREGRIASDYEGFGHRVLTLAIHGKPDAHVQLNAWGNDSGEAGWSWLCEDFQGGPKWLPLGDHHTTVE